MTADLLTLLPGPFHREAATSGGEYSAPCPKCGGRDRFRIWPQATPKPHAWCRGCGWQPDAIDVLRELHGLAYPDAVAALDGRVGLPRVSAGSPPVSIDARPPSTTWQARGRALLATWQAALWAEPGAQALAWLRDQRHLTDATIRAAGLGYVARECIDAPAAWGLEGTRISVSRGIVLPWEAAGALWALKVRRPAGTPKYLQVRGGRPALYGVDQLASRAVLVFTEGEFDALLLRQECGDLVDVVTLGSATAPLGDRWLVALLAARQLLAAYDVDAAGQRGARTLGAFSARVAVAPPIGAKDLTAMVAAGGDLRAWVAYHLTRLADGEAAAPIVVERLVTRRSSATAIEQAPAPPPPLPRCYACGETRYWRRPDDGARVCAVCHPPPGDTEGA